MLEHQKKTLEAKYSDYILKLEPYLLRVSGYNPQETRLKINGYLLHCTPGTFSLTGCKLILSLRSQEIKFFKEYEKKIISLKLSFDSPYFGKSVSFFIKGRMDSLIEVRENVYTLYMVFVSTSDTYKELFLHLSEISSIYKKIYHTKLTEDQINGIKMTPITYAQIIKNGQVFCYGKLISISPRHFEISLDQQNCELTWNEKYKYTITYNNRTINLTGTIVKKDNNNYISTIDFNMEYIHIITIYMNMSQGKNTGNNQDTEELEEL